MVSPTEIDAIQKYILTPLADNGAVFRIISDDEKLPYIVGIKNKIELYKKDIRRIYDVISQVRWLLEENWRQPENVDDDLIYDVVQEGVDNYVEYMEKLEKKRTRARAKGVYNTLLKTTPLNPNVIGIITEFNTGKKLKNLSGGSRKNLKMKRKLRKTKKNKNR